MKTFLTFFLIILLFTGCRDKEMEAIVPAYPEKPETPSVILEDHKYFLKRLEQVRFYEDSTGIAARKLYEVMEYHFKEEEDYVLPPLGILPGLAKGQTPEETENIILLTEKFRKYESVMLAEHQMISHYTKEMMHAAKKEGHPELLGFDAELEKHAALEEEILFPAVLLIGDYLKQRSGKGMEE